MRVIIKNADFSVYGLADIGDLMSEVTAKFGGITNPAPVEAFFRSLGADGSNAIWGKIKYLYMPCLGVQADGADALYDIIGKQNYSGSNYVIEAKRGVSPSTLGASIGNVTIPADTVDADNFSGFFVFTQSSRQTLGSSSGDLVMICGRSIVWGNTTITIGAATLTNDTAFSVPQYVVFSKRTNGTNTVIGKDDTQTAAVEKISNSICLSGNSSWAATALYALCSGLTADEAAIAASALETFITDFGVVSANS